MEEWKKIGRDFMKSLKFEELDKIDTDQEKGLAKPELEKQITEGCELFDLPDPKSVDLKKKDILKVFEERVSRRVFTSESITLLELSFLLWSTQGVKKIMGDNYCTLRTVPSGGARHTYETYLWINKVEGLEKGIYRYLSIENRLAPVKKGDFNIEVSEAAMGQKFAGESAVTFIWAAIPYRGEWRYMMGSHKVQLIDAGHLCQNLYLACEALGLGTCAIAAYCQENFDKLLEIDGQDEFTVYLSPVGKIK